MVLFFPFACIHAVAHGSHGIMESGSYIPSPEMYRFYLMQTADASGHTEHGERGLLLYSNLLLCSPGIHICVPEELPFEDLTNMMMYKKYEAYSH